MTIWDIKYTAYLLARSDMGTDHPKGVAVLDPIFEQLGDALMDAIGADQEPPGKRPDPWAGDEDKARWRDSRAFTEGYNRAKAEVRREFKLSLQAYYQRTQEQRGQIADSPVSALPTETAMPEALEEWRCGKCGNCRACGNTGRSWEGRYCGCPWGDRLRASQPAETAQEA